MSYIAVLIAESSRGISSRWEVPQGAFCAVSGYLYEGIPGNPFTDS